MTTTRQRALDAALELIGTQGLRALTHRRIDEHAGLPAGSTSNYARTRAALLAATLQRIIELESPSVRDVPLPASAEEFVEFAAGLIDLTTGERRVLTTARLTLFMEASHDEALRAEISHGRQVLARYITAIFAGMGAEDPEAAALALMSCSEGIILHRIVRHEHSDARPALRVVVRGALAGARTE